MTINLYTSINGSCPNGTWKLQAFSLTGSSGVPTTPYGSTTFTHSGGSTSYSGIPVNMSGGYNISVNTLPKGYYHFVYTTTGCCYPSELDLYIISKKNSPLVLVNSYTNNKKRIFSSWGNQYGFSTGNNSPYDSAFDVGILELNGSAISIKYQWFLQHVADTSGGGFTVNYTQLGTTSSSPYIDNLKVGGQTPNGAFQVGDIIDEIAYQSGGPSFTTKFNTLSTNITISSNNTTNSTALTNAFRAVQVSSIQSFINVIYSNGYINLYSSPYAGSVNSACLSTGEVWRISYTRAGNPLTVDFTISATGNVNVNYSNTSYTYTNTGCQTPITRTYPSFVNIFGLVSNPSPFWLTTRGLATAGGEILKFYLPSETPVVPPNQQLVLTPNGQATNPFTTCYIGTTTVSSADCPTEVTGVVVTAPATASGNVITWNGSTSFNYSATYTTNSLCCL